MTLFDFSRRDAVAAWVPINDGVMGGVSTGNLAFSPEGTAVFAGRVSLDNNGGFASVRSRPRALDLRSFSGVELRVRGDGRTYKLNLKDDRRFDGVLHRTSFETLEGEWQTVRFRFADLVPGFRGRVLTDAPPLELSRVTSVGLMISDKQAGPFRLEVAWIKAFRESARLR